ncbi:MAG: helix-turn-helix transcriptional regulator, partial [Clostridia bacterium]|nr:helix-turn-helix transcriptional regulator [Clostridia bacterium]
VAIGRRYDSIIGSSIPQKERFDQIRDKMIANYSNEWKLSQLADMSGYSQSYFCSKYKKLYGISPIDELLSFRINQAKNELLRKNCSITEISEKCGFASIQHFSRYFKRLVGMTPSEYANQTPKTVAK